MSGDTSSISLKVSDDGKGFDANIVREGNGLVNIRRRVMSLGGELRIESQIGGGTTIDMKVPLRPSRKSMFKRFR